MTTAITILPCKLIPVSVEAHIPTLLQVSRDVWGIKVDRFTVPVAFGTLQLSILAGESGGCRNESSPVPPGPRVGGEQDRFGPCLK